MKTTIKNYYFPSGLRYFWGILGIISGLYLLIRDPQVWIFAGILILSAVLMFTVFSQIVIDRSNGLIYSTFRILMIPFNSESLTFNQLNRIRLDKERVSYTTNSARGGRSGKADFFVYTAVIEYDQADEFEILSKTDWQPFKEHIKHIAEDLQIEVVRNL